MDVIVDGESQLFKEASFSRAVWLGACIFFGLTLKVFYRDAGPDQLRFVLGPTAFGVELLTGARFLFEHGQGYVHIGRRFEIAPACAGLNFMTAAFWVLGLSKLWGPMQPGFRWAAEMIRIIFVAYVCTVVVNAVRISLLLLARDGSYLAFVDQDVVHRVIGTVLYFLALLALHGYSRGRSPVMLPILAYLVVVGFIPLANGALQNPKFGTHIASVLAVLLFSFAITLVWGWVRLKFRPAHPKTLGASLPIDRP